MFDTKRVTMLAIAGLLATASIAPAAAATHHRHHAHAVTQSQVPMDEPDFSLALEPDSSEY